MRKAERGVGSGRFAWIGLLGSLGVALSGCGASGSSSAAAATPSSSAAASTPSSAGTVTSTAPSASPGSSSTSTSGTTTTPTTAPTTVAASSVTLGWVPPTENSNGTPITDLAGYKIHYGTASANYSQTVSISNAGLTRYVVDNLATGTYYFAITAYNVQGMESALSGEVTTTVN